MLVCHSISYPLSGVQPWGGGWAWLLSKDILLKCRTNDDIYQPGWVGCVLAFLALCKVWLCVEVLCALQCAKNSVGSGGKVMLA